MWFEEVPRSSDARVVIRYVPDPFQCGNVPNATGCCDRQMGPDGQTLIRMGRSRLATPDDPKCFFKGILHEGAHAAFWATHGARLRLRRAEGWDHGSGLASCDLAYRGRHLERSGLHRGPEPHQALKRISEGHASEMR